MDRLIRVRVLDKNGRSIPDATVSVFVNGAFIGKATSASDNAGTLYTFQVIYTGVVNVALTAEYKGETPLNAKLSQGTDDWDFTFNNVEVPMPRDKSFWEEHIPGLLGVAFLLICIVLAVVFSNPSEFQRRVFIGALAIGLAGIGAEIPGFLNVQLTLGQKLGVTAAGALGIFVLVYFFVPA